MIKKKITLLLMTLFLLPTFFTTNQSVSANATLASELVRKEANKYCNSISTASIQLFGIDNYDYDDANMVTLTEEEYKEWLQNEQENNNELMQYEEGIKEDTIELYSTKPPMFVEKTAKSKAGSMVVLPTKVDYKYGYCHIFKYHMDKTNYTQGYSVIINGEKKSQFVYAKSSDQTMNIAMEVINSTPNLSCVEPKRVRCTKEGFSKTAAVNSKVVMHRGSNWGGYNQYDWVIVSLYPKFN